MPQLVAAVVAAVGITGTAATIATAALTMGLSYGLSQLARPKGPKPTDGQIITRQSIASRKRHYGQVMVGGTLAYHNSSGGTLGYIVTAGHGQIDSWIEHRINNEVVTIGGGGVVSTAKFEGALRIITREGDPDQTAIGEMSAIFGEWTADHRMRGCSAAAIIAAPVKQKKFAAVYDNREPEWLGALKGSRVYDPRLDSTRAGGSGPHRTDDPDTWTYSDNAALVIADYMAHPDGFGRGMAGINWDNIAAEADLADDELTTVDSRTIRRWRLWGSYSLDDQERRDVLAGMMAACDASCRDDADGLFCLSLGRWTAPTVTITDDHIIAMDCTRGRAGPDEASAMRAVFTDPNADYAEQEAAPYPNPDALDSRVARLPLYWCPDHNQGVRVAKRVWLEGQNRWQLSIVTNLYGLNALGERIITVASDAMQINAPFMVKGLTFLPTVNRVELTLQEVAESDWDFDALTEEGEPPIVENATPALAAIPAPENVTLSAVARMLGGTNGVAIAAIWDEPEREGLIFAAEYQADGDAGWTPMQVNDDEFTGVSGLVSSGVEHSVRVKAIAISGRESAWSTIETITPEADNSGVSAPGLTSATGGAGQAVLGWRNPFEAAFDHVEIWHNTSASLTGAAQAGPDQMGALGEVMSWTHSGLSAGNHYYWIRSYNAAGAYAASAILTATVT